MSGGRGVCLYCEIREKKALKFCSTVEILYVYLICLHVAKIRTLLKHILSLLNDALK